METSPIDPTGPASEEESTLPRTDPPRAQRRIGNYRVLRELGHGGMGTVFLAARADDEYQKRVAIKVIRGVDNDEVIRLFRRERQILASLEHPNIARFLDGGSTDDGLPYFVLEHVEGQPLDVYCDERKLSTRERLTLFLGVCAAVDFAHRNLVIHRDLKPGNIVVTSDGIPKLLDFGIARLVNPEMAGDLQTLTGLAGTPEYASPEQARGRPLTTSTDVYSLGVVLYELLTGHRPYGPQSTDPLQVLKAICEEEPVKPSTVVNRPELLRRSRTLSPIPTEESVSRAREGSPQKLRHQLRGDLDNILLTVLRKEPQRRYGSVEALTADIRRYLEGRPVAARRSTPAYRVGKFVRRNAWGVLAAGMVAVLLVSLAVVSSIQSRRVARERDAAEKARVRSVRLADFLTGLFKVSDPSEARGNSITAREVLDKGAERIASELKDDPDTQATLMATMGIVYQELGLIRKGREVLEETLELRRKALPPGHPDLVRSLLDAGWASSLLGDFPRAETLYQQAIDMERQGSRLESPMMAKALFMLGELRYRRGDLAAAEESARNALSLHRKLGARDDLNLTSDFQLLGAILLDKGDLRGAEASFRESLEMARRLTGDSSPHVMSNLSNLSVVLEAEGDLAGAESMNRQALDLARRLYGPEHHDVASAAFNLSIVLSKKGDLKGAEELAEEALHIEVKARGAESPPVAEVLGQLADIRLKEGRPREAEILARRAVAIHRKALDPESRNLAISQARLGDCLRALGRFAEAEPLLLSSFELFERKYPDLLESEGRPKVVALYRAWGKPAKAAIFEMRAAPEGGAAEARAPVPQ